MSLNKVMIIGNVGGEPEIRYSGEQKVASIKVAATDRYKDKSTGETKEVTEWFSVVCWRNTADIVDKYIQKGSQVYVEGKLRTRKWTDQDGVTRYATDVIADSIQLLGRKPQDAQQESSGDSF